MMQSRVRRRPDFRLSRFAGILAVSLVAVVAASAEPPARANPDPAAALAAEEEEIRQALEAVPDLPEASEVPLSEPDAALENPPQPALPAPDLDALPPQADVGDAATAPGRPGAKPKLPQKAGTGPRPGRRATRPAPPALDPKAIAAEEDALLGVESEVRGFQPPVPVGVAPAVPAGAAESGGSDNTPDPAFRPEMEASEGAATVDASGGVVLEPPVAPEEVGAPAEPLALDEARLQADVGRWLDCGACGHGELQAVLSHGPAAGYFLDYALRQGPSPAAREALRRHLVSRFFDLRTYQLTHPWAQPAEGMREFVDRYMAAYDLQVRFRAAVALKRVDPRRAKAAMEAMRRVGVAPAVDIWLLGQQGEP